MKVLHFYSTYFPDSVGGAELAIKQICQATKTFGVEPTVLTLSQNPVPRLIDHDGQVVIRQKTSLNLASTRFSLGAILEFKKLALSHDIVHFHFPWPFADLCQLLSGSKTPYLVTYHSDIVKQRFLSKLYAPLMHRFLGQAQRIVATSPQYIETSQVLRRYSGKTCAIPLSINAAAFAANDKTLEPSRFKKIPKPFFLFIGVLRYYKGLHLLIEAAREAEIDIVIAGTGPLAKDLSLQAAGLSNVKLVGAITDEEKVDLLSSAYGFVFPSHMRSEAFGMSLLEAASFGLPLITFEIGTGTSSINLHNETGIVLEASCLASSKAASASLASAMRRLWSAPTWAKALGLRGRERVESHFNSNAMGRRYYDLYQKMLAKE